MVLSGSIGKSLVDNLAQVGIKAVGISGTDGRTFLCEKKKDEKGRDLGFVGEIRKVDTTLVDSLLKSNFVPVLSPVGVDTEGNTYNINADYAASAIAGALSAQKLIFLTDVEGILKDKDDLPRSSDPDPRRAVSISSRIIKGGMIPRFNAA